MVKKKEKYSKKKRWSTISMGLIFLIGLGVFSYPVVSNLYADFFHTRVIDNYQKEVNSKSVKKKKELRSQLIDYNRSLAKGTTVQPDPFEEKKEVIVPKHKVIDALEKELGEVLGVLDIPSIHSKLPIYGGSSDLQLQKGVGVLEGTSLPIGGDGTHSVITGHRGLPSSKLFTDLPNLKLGDQFTINILGEEHLYKIDRIVIVLPQETDDLQIMKDKDYVTLLTCTPYMVNTHRLLVRGHRVPTKEKIEKPEEICDHHLILLLIVLSMLILVLLKKKGNKIKDIEEKR